MILMGVIGCDRNTYYDKHYDVDERGWRQEEALTFDVNIEDTTQYYDLYVDVRNTIEYGYSNFFMFITTSFPNGNEAKDTLECPMADEMGHWYGHHSGRLVDNRYVFHRKTCFPSRGVYRISMRHGMRDSAVTGIKNIGFKMELSHR